jgi:predicted NBD/HSP70 family sugar kinase
MQHYVGLDVSVKGTNVCIVDKAGKVIREVKVATEPEAIFAVLTEEALAIERPVARRMAVIMHRMWVDGTEFRWTREEAAAT